MVGALAMTKHRRLSWWAAILAALLALDIHAAAVDAKPFADPAQEQLYKSLTAELRCLVCQNQTIADSNADLAKDLREEVYRRVQSGHSEQEIIDFMTARYGDFVLYRPRWSMKTVLLWLGPGGFLLVGGFLLWRYQRQRQQARLELDEVARNEARRWLQSEDEP